MVNNWSDYEAPRGRHPLLNPSKAVGKGLSLPVILPKYGGMGPSFGYRGNAHLSLATHTSKHWSIVRFCLRAAHCGCVRACFQSVRAQFWGG